SASLPVPLSPSIKTVVGFSRIFSSVRYTEIIGESAEKTSGYACSLPLDVVGLKLCRLWAPGPPPSGTLCRIQLKHALCNQLMSIAPLAGPPQAFEVVKLTRPSRENVNHE